MLTAMCGGRVYELHPLLLPVGEFPFTSYYRFEIYAHISQGSSKKAARANNKYTARRR
jgi:hypothetical protein